MHKHMAHVQCIFFFWSKYQSFRKPVWSRQIFMCLKLMFLYLVAGNSFERKTAAWKKLLSSRFQRPIHTLWSLPELRRLPWQEARSSTKIGHSHPSVCMLYRVILPLPRTYWDLPDNMAWKRCRERMSVSAVDLPFAQSLILNLFHD
jgi:hypothetical protein